MLNVAKRMWLSGSWSYTTGSGTVTVADDGHPTSWTNPTTSTISISVYDPTGSNGIDGFQSSNGVPSLYGTWTLIYDDSQAGTANATTLSLSTGNNANMAFSQSSSTTSGNTTTITYSQAQAKYNATNLSADLSLNVSQPTTTNSTGSWNISNLFIIPPNNPSATRASLMANPLAMDANVRKWLVSSKNQTPAALRFMDANATSGISNYQLAADLPDPSWFAWGGVKVPSSFPYNSDGAGNNTSYGTITFTQYRPYITNPALGSTASGGNNTYNWAISGKVYLTSEWAENWGITTSDGNGYYLDMTSSTALLNSNGAAFLPYVGALGGWFAVELVSEYAHGLRTGDFIDTLLNFTFPNITTTTSTAYLDYNTTNAVVYVTSPTTIVVLVACNGTGSTLGQIASSPGGSVAKSPTTFSPYPTATYTLPAPPVLPFEFDAATASLLRSNLWISVPRWASDQCSAAIASKIAAYLAPGLKVYVEYMNEHWNTWTINSWTAGVLSTLVSYLPPGTQIGNYYTVPEGAAPLSSDQFYTIQAARHHDIWASTFAALGRESDVVRVFGAQGSAASVQNTIVATATQYGIPIDALAIALYSQVPDDPTFTAAVTPAGGPASSGFAAGNWPIGAFADLCRHSTYYNTSYWPWFSTAANACSYYGQPVFSLGTSQASSSGGSLSAGYYTLGCTLVASSGQESTLGGSTSGLLVTSGYQYHATLPNAPAGYTVNVYLSSPNGLPSTMSLYATGQSPGATFTFSSNTWANSAHLPPSTNQIPLPGGRQSSHAGRVRILAATHRAERGALRHATRVRYVLPPLVPRRRHNLVRHDAGWPSWGREQRVLASQFLRVGPRMVRIHVSRRRHVGAGRVSRPAGWIRLVESVHYDAGGLAGRQLPARHLQPGGRNPAAPGLDERRRTAGPDHHGDVARLERDGGRGGKNPVVATFSEAIQPSGLTFTIAPTAGGANVAGAVNVDSTDTVATFVTSKAFDYSTGYTASIQATGSDDTPMASAYTWSWTTNEPPPTGSWYIQPLCFGFDSAILATDLTIEATVNSLSFPGTTSYDSSTYVATFTPTRPWVAGAKYLLTISGATASDGTPMASQTIAFTPIRRRSRKRVVRRAWKRHPEGLTVSRERDVRNAIQAALMATGAFSGVWITGLPEKCGQGASDLTAAAIEPVGTTCTTGWDSAQQATWIIRQPAR